MFCNLCGGASKKNGVVCDECGFRRSQIEPSLVKINTSNRKGIDAAKNMNNLANQYKKLGQYDAAEQLYQDSFLIVESEQGRASPVVMGILKNLVFCYQQQNKYVMIAITMTVMANCCQQQGKYNEAYTLLECSLRVLNESFPEGDKAIDKIQKNLDNLKRKIN